MGATGPDGEAVGEKAWDRNEDETPNDASEKNESGPSIRDKDKSSRELRAKDEGGPDEPGKANYDELDDHNDDTGSQDDIGDGETTDAVNLEKEAAVSDPAGMEPDELEQTSDMDLDLNGMPEEDFMEEGDPGEQGDSVEDENQDRKQGEETCPPDEIMEDSHTEVGVTSDEDNLGGDHQENSDMNSIETKKSEPEPEPGSADMGNEQVASVELPSQSNVGWKSSYSENIAAESNWSNSIESFDNPTLMGGIPSNSMSKMDHMMSESSDAGGLTEKQPKSLPQHEHSLVQERLPNPYRNLGDALEEWKERVNIAGDLPADNMEKQGEMEDDNAEEYGYVSEFEKGTAQAMGPATSEQIDRNIDGNKLDKESLTAEKDAEMQMEKQNSDMKSTSDSTLIPKNEKREHINVSGTEKSHDEGSVKMDASESADVEHLSEDLISVKRSYFSEGLHKLSQLSVDDSDFGKAQDPPDVPSDVKDNATALWKRYELSTTKLSQELAEQLRLVMEPTVASKLQGDFRTGKRINMKKVIPYIASHYRKDKIWLRRTRPNKRDYQVVLAIDDSSSMSESCCGDIAVEALVTVCRAVSQLEMGSLAIASFGTKGNIKLLHDFDRPFTGEAGVKMISHLTFKQENTIINEPVVDLLKFLTNKLDSAVVKARLPSGHNPLQQLVLIISDGQFHEKDHLKRCIRDLSGGNRMVAFLLLDNSQDSIMDRSEASFDQNGKMKLSKYMDSFPFPYYIVLRNIEALPRTLADLLRQWMELMQHPMG
ncbi:midasin [Senna tora]|uniref:Midasin n=1 Tax=Senna tora TaxID=362788 RepID=A0A834XGK2_9FABA|nr:midasin [Senna tora]